MDNKELIGSTGPIDLGIKPLTTKSNPSENDNNGAKTKQGSKKGPHKKLYFNHHFPI